MIVSAIDNPNRDEFEGILAVTYSQLKNMADTNPAYFASKTASEFEKDVFQQMRDAAKGTIFEGAITLVSGHKFPDIVARRFYGVEVKTTRLNTWRSTGNSVLESTRIEDVERIYIFFAKFHEPIDFKYRLYQECLYDIAVTHSPRYLIDMDLGPNDNIFKRLRLTYDQLRKLENPIKEIVSYYRSICKKGEEPWWMDDGDSSKVMAKPFVRIWRNLSSEEQNHIRNQAFARFPEILGASSQKYQRLATWLVVSHGIVDASLRDRFSAGGKFDISIRGKSYRFLPRVLEHVSNNIHEIVRAVDELTPEEAKYYWGLEIEPKSADEKLEVWKDLLKRAVSGTSRDFLVDLLDSIDGFK